MTALSTCICSSIYRLPLLFCCLILRFCRSFQCKSFQSKDLFTLLVAVESLCSAHNGPKFVQLHQVMDGHQHQHGQSPACHCCDACECRCRQTNPFYFSTSDHVWAKMMPKKLQVSQGSMINQSLYFSLFLLVSHSLPLFHLFNDFISLLSLSLSVGPHSSDSLRVLFTSSCSSRGRVARSASSKARLPRRVSPDRPNSQSQRRPSRKSDTNSILHIYIFLILINIT